MRYRSLGESGIKASVIGIGTWAIGGSEWGGTEQKASLDSINAALDAGVNLIDTAPFYGRGVSEELVGKALKGQRDRAVLATKCGLYWEMGKGEFFYKDPNTKAKIYRYLGADGIRQEIENSLRRLQTETIDLYQTHWQDSTTPVEETMEVLLKLKKEGKIRAIGVSNVTPAQLCEYLKWGPVDSDQELFNMLDRNNGVKLFPLCVQRKIAVLAYSPMAMGLLSGKIDAARQFPQGDIRRFRARFSVENRKKLQPFADRLKPFAEAHGLTLAQLVIAWTTEQPGLTHVLCGARNPKQAKENARAGGALLSKHEIAAINRVVEEENLQLPPLFGC